MGRVEGGSPRIREVCEVWGEFAQVVTKRQVVEEEVSVVSGGNVAGGG